MKFQRYKHGIEKTTLKANAPGLSDDLVDWINENIKDMNRLENEIDKLKNIF